MFKHTINSRRLWQGLALACVIAGSTAATSVAFAGECPPTRPKPTAREKVDLKPVGVTDVTLVRSISRSNPQTSRTASCASAS